MAFGKNSYNGKYSASRPKGGLQASTAPQFSLKGSSLEGKSREEWTEMDHIVRREEIREQVLKRLAGVRAISMEELKTGKSDLIEHVSASSIGIVGKIARERGAGSNDPWAKCRKILGFKNTEKQESFGEALERTTPDGKSTTDKPVVPNIQVPRDK